MALDGFLSRGQCFQSLQDAAMDACSAYPITSTSGTKVYTWHCMGLNPAGTRLTLNRYETGLLDPTVQNIPFSFAACDPSAQYLELFSTWYVLLAAVALVFAVRRVYSVFANPK